MSERFSSTKFGSVMTGSSAKSGSVMTVSLILDRIVWMDHGARRRTSQTQAQRSWTSEPVAGRGPGLRRIGEDKGSKLDAVYNRWAMRSAPAAGLLAKSAGTAGDQLNSAELSIQVLGS
ncbi:hypothetical protein F2Q68_00003545 [Brassica cretica]|uniref:Uncharacterized protein n=1 Tax=Brassica cretica TaxID=69181 RepID=A0A8S9JDR2_BRACR|nr:hypothetical protein F2Q68_00003545 [Brassica cretica]